MLAGGVGADDTSVRLIALLIAGLLVVPATLLLAWPRRGGDPAAEGPRRRPLDLIWAAVPVVLLAVLATFSATA